MLPELLKFVGMCQGYHDDATLVTMTTKLATTTTILVTMETALVTNYRYVCRDYHLPI